MTIEHSPSEQTAPAPSDLSQEQAAFERYLLTLRNAGHRITEQRQKICRYLAKTELHPTPYQVYTDLKALYPDISRATVYNTLNTLQSLGAIVEINFGADHTHYDTDPQPHINLICLRCHAIEDWHEELPFVEMVANAAAHSQFTAVATKVDILGICEQCRQAEAEQRTMPSE